MRNKKKWEVIIHLSTKNGDIEQLIITNVVHILENNNLLQLQTQDNRFLFYPIHRIEFFSERDITKEYIL